MIPHSYSYSPSASPQQELEWLLPCLGLPQSVQAELATPTLSGIAGMAELGELRIRGESACEEAGETLKTVLPALIHALLEDPHAGDGFAGD